MSRLVGILIVLVLLAFGLPALFNVLENLIIPSIVFVGIVGIGAFLFRRGRNW